MNPLAHLNKDSIHHAYIVEGSSASSRTAVLDFLKNSFDMQPGHSDLFMLDRPDFGIEDAQEIIDINSRKPARGARKAVVISLGSISHQAQNSLLKVLEEPRPGTVFFILTQVSSMFLPTVLSRVHVLKGNDHSNVRNDESAPGVDAIAKTTKAGKGDKADKADKVDKMRDAIAAALSPENFLASGKAERLAIAKKIIELKSDEKIGDGEVFAFVQGLERIAYDHAKNSSGEKMSPARIAVAKVFTKVDEYIRDASSSKKMLLEYLALSLPQV